MNIEDMIKEKRGTILDVRTPEEFQGGHAEGSINIPLQALPNQVDEIKKLQMPLILCCASGNRSRQAHRFLVRHNIECHDAGSWLNVHQLQTQTSEQV